MSRITLDLEALVAEGRLTAEEATRLKGMAAPGRGLSNIVQVLYIFGALGLAGGVLALKPDPMTGMVLAALAIGFAVFAQATKREDMGLLGTALGIAGAVGLCGSFGLQFGEQLSAFTVNAVVAVILLAIALLLRSRFLAALVPLAIAALVGSSTAYWHASYAIIIREPAVTVFVFAVLSGVFFLAASRLKGLWANMASDAGKVSWLVLNFAFWVGSLWGDEFGDHFLTAELPLGPDGAPVQAANSLFVIPDLVFILGWAALSVASIVALHRNRFAVNASITFLAINAYTQFFEWFGESAIVLITGGVTLLAFAFGLYHFDKWMVARNRAAAPVA